MNNDIMQQATDSINMQDDKMDGGMGLGNSMGLSETGANIDTDRPNYGYQHDTGQGTTEATKEEDKGDYEPKETEQTQGEYERELQNNREKQETIRDDLDILKEGIKNAKDKYEYFETLEKYIEQYGDPNKNYKDFDQVVEDIIKGMENELTTLYDREYEIMNNDEYDPRDYGETREDKKQEEAIKREDDETNRAVEAMKKAGLNPATLHGSISYGGGGGISSSGGGKSSDEEDEEKRRKRKREEEAARQRAEAERQQQNKQMIMQVVQMLGGIGGTLGAAAIRNQGLMGMANIRGQSYLDTANIRNMNAIELQKMRQSGNMRLQNKRHEQAQERNNMQLLFRNKANNERNYQNIQRDKRRRYGYYDDIDLDETYMGQYNRKKYG